MQRQRVVAVAIAVIVSILSPWMVSVTSAEEMKGQIFFRGGAAILTDSRQRQLFTDALGTGGRLNNGDKGFSVGAGIDHVLFKDPWFKNPLLGEIMLDYAQFSRKQVTQSGGLTGRLSKVTVNELAVVAAPKYMIELGKWRPWIIPVGLEWQVISPPSDDTTYLDIGMHFGTGIEYRIIDQISIGIDLRYHWSANSTNAGAVSFLTTGGYIGFNF